MLDAIQQQGFKGFDISDNEMAKSHTRYMVGGCAIVPDERLFRFGGSKNDHYTRVFTRLQSSPSGLGPCANSWRAFNEGGISLCSIIATMVQVSLSHWHQCHHLACTVDLGKVLTGIQVPPQDYDQFQLFLDKLGYHYVEETDNEVYKRYLRG